MDPELAEIGASGRTWDREGVALLVYATEASKRSSLWVHGDDGWQVRFHQGTPT